MKHLECDLKTCCQKVKDQRNIVHPVEEYLTQLLKYELRLRQENSCTLDDLNELFQAGKNMFTSPLLKNYKQRCFGNETDDEEDEQPGFGNEPRDEEDEQPDFGTETLSGFQSLKSYDANANACAEGLVSPKHIDCDLLIPMSPNRVECNLMIPTIPDIPIVTTPTNAEEKELSQSPHRDESPSMMNGVQLPLNIPCLVTPRSGALSPGSARDTPGSARSDIRSERSWVMVDERAKMGHAATSVARAAALGMDLPEADCLSPFDYLMGK